MAAPAPSTAPSFTHRPWVAAGVALTAASMVAATPVAAPTLQQVTFPEIELVAQDLLGDTAGNLTNLVNYFAGANLANSFLDPATFPLGRVGVGAPFPILQQVIANQVGYLGQFLQGDFTGPFESMFGNLQAGFAAPFDMFPDNLATGGGLTGTGLLAILQQLAQLIGVDPDLSRMGLFELASTLTQGTTLGDLLGFTASPVSGVMLGALGPILGPMIVLADGMGTAFGGDPGALLGIPEDMLYAFLNGGQVLDITDLLSLIGIDTTFDLDLGLLGDLSGGIKPVGIALGGILGGPGSLFNALTAAGGLEYTNPLDPLNILHLEAGIEFLGDGAGPLGSLMSVPNSIAAAIGEGGIMGMDGGLLSTISTAFGLDDITAGLTDISAFLSSNILDPLGDALSFLPNQLADLIGGALGSDLGIDALTAMLVNIPQLLLTMML